MERIVLKEGHVELIIDGGAAWRKYPVTGCSDYVTGIREGESPEAFRVRAEREARRLQELGW